MKKATAKILRSLVTAAIALRQGAAATTSSSYACVSESTDCANDAECYGCGLGAVENNDAFSDCFEVAIDNVDESLSCAARSMSACCYDFASDSDCLANDAFAAYHLCLVNSQYDGISGIEVDDCAALDCTGILDGSVEEVVGDDDADDTGGDDDGKNTVVGDDGDDDAGVDDGDDAMDAPIGVIPSTSTSEGSCLPEWQACVDEEECSGCVAVNHVEHQDEWNACWAGYAYDPTDVCTLLSGNICCTDAISPNGCAENALFVAFNVCAYSANAVATGQEECSSTVTCSTGASANAAGVGASVSIAVLTLAVGATLLTAAPFSVVIL